MNIAILQHTYNPTTIGWVQGLEIFKRRAPAVSLIAETGSEDVAEVRTNVAHRDIWAPHDSHEALVLPSAAGQSGMSAPEAMSRGHAVMVTDVVASSGSRRADVRSPVAVRDLSRSRARAGTRRPR